MLMPRFSELENHSEKSFGGNHVQSSTTVAAHTKMRLLSKVEQNIRQQQSMNQNKVAGQSQTINKLIHTAATGNGLVGDVDDLLMPLHTKDQSSIAGANGNSSFNSSIDSGIGNSSGGGGGGSGKESHARPERNLWSRAEMIEMLNIMQQMNALDQLNDRNVKSEHVFRQIEEVMRSKGYVKKSSIQIWTKWKFLKSTYNTTTRHGNGIPKVVPEQVYKVLCRMLQDHAAASSNGSVSVSGSGSGISSECGNSMDSSNTELSKPAVANEEIKDQLGVEHPIFGFRLGLIKPEPIDTGYETITGQPSSKEQELDATEFVQVHDQTQVLEHTPFTVNVKMEPEMDLGMDDTNTPPPTAPTSPSPPPSGLDQRDQDDSSSAFSMKSQAIAPLRVAAFANDAQRMASSKPSHGILHIERPGAANPNAGLGRSNRSIPLQSTSNINFVHPTSKLMLPRKQLPMRIPREIIVQPANARPLKPVPVRDTGYSLRPDRMIPDLEQSISPPQSPSPPILGQTVPKNSASFASTSKQAQIFTEEQQLSQYSRKRRLQFGQQPAPVPVKLQRSSNHYENHNRPSNLHSHDVSATEEQTSKRLVEEAERRNQQQEEMFKKELSQLTNAMRIAQKEMLQDFFQQQKQFSRREHEFQLKQDNLVMTALRKQSDILLRAAKELMQCEEEQEEEPEKEEETSANCTTSFASHQEQETTEEDTAKDTLQTEDYEKHENEETEQREHEQLDEEAEQFDEDEDEDETQPSEVGNQSDAAISASNEASSSLSGSLSDAQMC